MADETLAFTNDELTAFDRATMRACSRDQVIRIEGRIEIKQLLDLHGKEKCDAMFAEITAKEKAARGKKRVMANVLDTFPEPHAEREIVLAVYPLATIESTENGLFRYSVVSEPGQGGVPLSGRKIVPNDAWRSAAKRMRKK